MHELGIAFHIISEVDKIAEQNNVKEVKSVTLEIGEVSSVIPKYLEDVWIWACENRSTHMKNCKLNIVVTKAISQTNHQSMLRRSFGFYKPTLAL